MRLREKGFSRIPRRFARRGSITVPTAPIIATQLSAARVYDLDKRVNHNDEPIMAGGSWPGAGGSFRLRQRAAELGCDRGGLQRVLELQTPGLIITRDTPCHNYVSLTCSPDCALGDYSQSMIGAYLSRRKRAVEAAKGILGFIDIGRICIVKRGQDTAWLGCSCVPLFV